MIEIPGYEIDTEIHFLRNSHVFYAKRNSDDHPVVLKVLSGEYANLEAVARLRHEYEILQSLPLPEVIRTDEWIAHRDTYAIVMENFGGRSLDRWLRLSEGGSLHLFDTATLNWQDVFLRLAMRLATAVNQLHQQRIIHLDINPSNILMQPDSGYIKLIDFGASTRLTYEDATFQNPEALQGTLEYMSPEQTGRMNRMVDYRSDLYSLGATFYALLCGKPPFVSSNPMQLVYAHLTREPAPPHEIKPIIYPTISNIVLKLLAKDPGERYQSARGLMNDLSVCLKQLEVSHHITPFDLGQQDVSNRFQISPKLYAREQEIQLLIDAFERVNQTELDSPGKSELVLITGEMGIGKTSLAQELFTPITQRGGYFISGKFDRHQRSGPYSGLFQALRALINQILTESQPQIAAWSQRILAAVQSNGQLIFNILPEVEQIIGLQPAVPDLPAQESENRFRLVLESFIRVFAHSGHPLVIFLDELHWADRASFDIIESLISRPDGSSLLLIGAYQDDLVDENHPINTLVEQIQSSRDRINILPLSLLRLDHIVELVTDTLHCHTDEAGELSTLLLEKTTGNPFFLTTFLRDLFHEKLLVFDAAWGSWQWSVNKIQEHAADDATALLMRKLKQLPLGSRRVLRMAACLGEQFDLHTLSIVMDKPHHEIAHNLWDALEQELLLPVGDTYKLAMVTLKDIKTRFAAEYHFTHDSIHQTTRSMISPEDLQELNLTAGKQLVKHTKSDEYQQQIFEIAHHLNISSPLIRRRNLREELSQYNFKAGSKARELAAYDMAYQFFKEGISHLESDGWKRQKSLMMELHIAAAESACLSGRPEEVKQLVSNIEQRIDNVLDRVRAYRVKVRSYILREEHQEAILGGLEILSLLDFQLTEDPSMADIEEAVKQVETLLVGKQPEELKNLTAMKDPQNLAAMGVLRDLTIPAFDTNYLLFALLSIKRIHLMLNYGTVPDAANIYASYGIILCSLLNRIQDGYDFGKLALGLLEKPDAGEQKAAALFSINTYIRHWKEPYHQALDSLLEGYQSGLDYGDLEYAAYCLLEHSYCSLLTGAPLRPLTREMTNTSKILQYQLKQHTVFQLHQAYHQTASNLTGQTQEPWNLSGRYFDAESILAEFQKSDDSYKLCIVYTFRMILAYLFGEYQQAQKEAAAAEKHLDAIQGRYNAAIFHFYDSLIQLSAYPEASQNKRKQIINKVELNQKKLEEWAQHAPENYLGKQRLVEAERSRVEGNDWEAGRRFSEAIELMHQNHFLNEEALACEMAGIFYLQQGQSRTAQLYLNDAHRLYLCWGAQAKADHLRDRFAEILSPPIPDTDADPESFVDPDGTSGYLRSTSMDAELLKAIDSFSDQIEPPLLLKKLVAVFAEYSGAQKGYLLLERENRLIIEAEILPGIDAIATTPIPIEQAEDRLPVEILNQSYGSVETILQRPSVSHGLLSQGPYFQQAQPAAALCLPLTHSRHAVGILYLETSQEDTGLSPQHVAFLEALAPYAANAIENALRYGDLQQKLVSNTAQMRAAMVEMESLSTTDKLTGAYNRRKFDEIALREINHIERFEYPLSLILLELSQFKNISARFGRQMEENVLKVISDKLRQKLRNMDILIRWDEEIFAVLTPETPFQGAQELSYRLKELITDHHFVGVGYLSTHVGIASFNKGETLSTFVTRTEASLKKSKTGGRSRLSGADIELPKRPARSRLSEALGDDPLYPVDDEEGKEDKDTGGLTALWTGK